MQNGELENLHRDDQPHGSRLSPMGLLYKIVMDKLRRSQGSSMPEDEKSLRKIVEVQFSTEEPRTSFPDQKHRETGEPFSP